MRYTKHCFSLNKLSFRLEEERRLAELRELERRNAEQRDQERREAAAREVARLADDRRSRDRLDIIAREREEKERWEMEKKRLIAEHEALARKRQGLTSRYEHRRADSGAVLAYLQLAFFRETLERLTRKPYYSGENLAYLSGPDVTTKVCLPYRVRGSLWIHVKEPRRSLNGYADSAFRLSVK